MNRRLWLLGCALSFFGTIDAAKAQSPPSDSIERRRCSVYQSVVNSGDIIPRSLLKDWQMALRCLMLIVEEIGRNVSSVQAVNLRKDLLSAARAIRIIMDENPEAAISLFRAQDSLGMISVLAFGARSDDYDIRLNTTLILGDIVDNTSLCVPIDHLFDPAINVNGRANLLSVVSTVASYATKENAANIERLLDHIGPIPKEQQHTVAKVDGLRRTITSRKDEGSASNEQCRSYVKRWAGDKMRYGP